METTNRTDRDENEVRRAEAIITVMDAYLASRSPEPGKSQLGEEYTAEYKTTEEIADELHSMLIWYRKEAKHEKKRQKAADTAGAAA